MKVKSMTPVLTKYIKTARKIAQLQVVISKIQCHLDILFHEATFLVEFSQLRLAIENNLITVSGLGMLNEVFDHAVAQVEPAGPFVYYHILYVAHLAASPDELPLYEYAACGNDAA